MLRFKQKSIFHPTFHLTPRQELFLLTVMGTPFTSEELMMEIIWPDPDKMPDLWNDILLDIQWHLNKKIVFSRFRIKKSRGRFRLEKLK